MKIIIAGSRTITETAFVFDIIDYTIYKHNLKISEIVCGMANGVDSIGYAYGTMYGIKISEFKANWSQYGRRAGVLRNIDMGNYADCLIAVQQNNSRGTKQMIEYMHQLSKPTYAYDYELVG